MSLASTGCYQMLLSPSKPSRSLWIIRGPVFALIHANIHRRPEWEDGTSDHGFAVTQPFRSQRRPTASSHTAQDTSTGVGGAEARCRSTTNSGITNTDWCTGTRSRRKEKERWVLFKQRNRGLCEAAAGARRRTSIPSFGVPT